MAQFSTRPITHSSCSAGEAIGNMYASQCATSSTNRLLYAHRDRLRTHHAPPGRPLEICTRVQAQPPQQIGSYTPIASRRQTASCKDVGSQSSRCWEMEGTRGSARTLACHAPEHMTSRTSSSGGACYGITPPRQRITDIEHGAGGTEPLPRRGKLRSKRRWKE